MAFLDNSGDIILDAVLTDAGRQRMARGNSKITKFALGDEEVNYGSFNGAHTSGSAFYDLEIMQTPVLEAFTNNTSMMKSKLITISRNNILYMPVLRPNNRLNNGTAQHDGAAGKMSFNTGYVLLADTRTEQNGTATPFDQANQGILRGVSNSGLAGDTTNHIAIDQGINTDAGGQSFKHLLDTDLMETAFLIRMDHRLLRLHQVNDAPNPGAIPTSTRAQPNQFVDDDGIASYYVAMNDGTTFVEGRPGDPRMLVEKNGGRGPAGEGNAPPPGRVGIIDSNQSISTPSEIGEAFPGPLGSILRFYPRSSDFVRQSTALFDELGNTGTSAVVIKTGTEISSYKYIDTLINIVGVTTGYSIDIPIRIVKKS